MSRRLFHLRDFIFLWSKRMTRLSKTSIRLKITKLLLFLILFFLIITEVMLAAEIHYNHFQWGNVNYPAKITVASKSSKFLRLIAFSGLYVSNYHNNFNSIDLRGKHIVSDIYFDRGRYQKIRISLGSDNVAGRYEQKSVDVTWLRFAISYEHWLGEKFALKPCFMYRSNSDPLYEVIQSRVPSNGFSFATKIRPSNSTFISSGFYISKLSSHSCLSDYGLFGEIMKYFRDYDWWLVRGYLIKNSFFNTRSVEVLGIYHFQFPAESKKIFFKVGVGLGNDVYEQGERIDHFLLSNEIKYTLTDRLAISFFYERNWSIYLKNQIGLHLQYSFLTSK